MTCLCVLQFLGKKLEDAFRGLRIITNLIGILLLGKEAVNLK